MIRNLGLAALLVILSSPTVTHAQNVDSLESAQLVREDEGPLAIPVQGRTHISIPLAKVHLPEIDFSDILEPTYLKSGPGTTTLRVSGRCSTPDSTATIHLRDRDGWLNTDDLLDEVTTNCEEETGRFAVDFVIWCTQSLGLTGGVNQIRGLEGKSGEEAPETYAAGGDGSERIPSAPDRDSYWVFHCSDRYQVIRR